jgi:hypothetical protein
MKFSFTTLIAILLVLVTVTVAQAQTPDSEAVTINNLRSNIQRMVGNAPAPAASEGADYRRQLQTLRSRLRDALIERRGGLKARIQNLRAPGALPEVLAHAQVLEKELTQLNGEVGGLNRDLAQTGDLPQAPAAPAQDQELAALRAEVEKLKEEQRKESEARMRSEVAAPAAAKEAAKEAADEAAKK